MKKVILQYLASALAVILILGLVVFNRQRNHSLVKKVKDPEISYIYQDSLENIDRLALSQAGVIQSYQLDALSVRKEDGKIHLVLHINHSYDMHSDTTRRGVKKKYQEATGEYRMAITQDIGQMQAEMKEETGWEPVCFTYPFGFINDEAQEIIREMGFKASLSSYEYVNRITKDPECLFELGRYNRASGESMGEFMAKMTDVR